MTDQVSMLIVDDEPSVRDSLKHWFLPEGFRVETVAEATEALDKMRDSSFDIVLLDIKMPGMDGIELQQRLREIDSQLAIIIMTAYATGYSNTGRQTGRLRLHNQTGRPGRPEQTRSQRDRAAPAHPREPEPKGRNPVTHLQLTRSSGKAGRCRRYSN